jgi:hypothetical protein
MAGMFYSLQEVAEKLKKTEEEIKQLAKQGKLREFRDGPHLLFKVDEVEALLADTGVAASKEPPAPKPAEPEESELELAEIETPEPESPEIEAAAPGKPAPPDTEEILLAPETGAPVPPPELTDADTALAGEGISVLGETDREDYQVTEDTMAETVASTGTTGTTPEPSLEEIEEDVSMDTFGSGSGLLDLSLQADDTSLGAILDEIYAGEGEVKEPAPAKTPEEAEPLAAEPELGAEISEEELVVPPTAGSMEVAAIAPVYLEPEPDVQSNTLGMLLFLPLVLFLYTSIVAVAGLRGIVPSILAKIQGAIWYIMIGAFVVAGAVVGAAFMLSRPPSAKVAAAKKEKKPKELKKSKKAKQAPPLAPEETSV